MATPELETEQKQNEQNEVWIAQQTKVKKFLFFICVHLI